MAVPTHLVHGATPLQSHPSSPRTPSTHWIPASVLTHLSLPQSSPVRWPPDSQRPPYSNQIPGTDSGCPRGPGHLARSAEGCYRGFWDDPGGARSGGMKSHPYFKTALHKKLIGLAPMNTFKLPLSSEIQCLKVEPLAISNGIPL